ncbi:hypothetical protein Fmac_007921 [Flemingia macrophylla]|uniref:Uncharacterized protein n=1 Tax=Flemingia macrophylla TaxID=520843 RepID=A0ABD1MVZ6_9FABA
MRDLVRVQRGGFFQSETGRRCVVKTIVKIPLGMCKKALRLKELADDIKSQRMKKNSGKGQKKPNKKDFVGGDTA